MFKLVINNINIFKSNITLVFSLMKIESNLISLSENFIKYTLLSNKM